LSFLLDTNVVSEPRRKKPDPAVMRWLHKVDEEKTFISVVTLSELRDGIDRMPVGAQRTQLEQWLILQIPERFGGRILEIDPELALACGRMMARQFKLGRRPDAMDAFIAATAAQEGLTLVTRNTADFENLGLSLINPWIEGAS